MKVKIKHHHEIVVSAASGAEVFNKHLYIISDNTEGVSVCDLNGKRLKTIPLSENICSERIVAKKIKSDYEACSIITRNNIDYLLIISSGSKKQHRNKAKLVNLTSNYSVESLEIETFFEVLRVKSGIAFEDFNIEALAFYDDTLYFCNRGGNQIIALNQEMFFAFVKNENKELKIETYKVEIDEINGVKAGISGASISESGLFILSVSAEQTTDWYNDGEVIGSALCCFHVSDLKEKFNINSHPLSFQGELLKTKIESVTIESMDDEKANLFLVSDNDGKDSELLEVTLYFN